MKLLLPQLFHQQDVRWGKKLLGNNTNPTFNLHNYGCLVAAEAMIACYYGKDTDPLRLNEQLAQNSGFIDGGRYVWNAINRIYPDISESIVKTPAPLTDAQMNEIKAAIDQGFPVIVQIDYNPKTAALDSHFVVITGYSQKDENDFTIADPLKSTEHSLKDYLGWMRPSARKTIEEYCIVKGKVPTMDQTQIVLTVKAQSGVNIRKSPDINGTIIKLALPGQKMKAMTTVPGTIVNGNGLWFKLAEGMFVWSGGVSVDTPLPSPVGGIEVEPEDGDTERALTVLDQAYAELKQPNMNREGFVRALIGAYKDQLAAPAPTPVDKEEVKGLLGRLGKLLGV